MAKIALAPPRPDPRSVAERPTGACLDCGAARMGRYCQACGQHHLDDRLTIRGVLREFAERFLKLERGLFPTAWRALRDPGRLARAYVGGQRRRFTNPISFLLIGSAVAVLLLPLYASPERILNDSSVGIHGTASAEAGLDLGIRISGGDPSDLTPEERERILAESAAMQAEFLPAYIATVNQLYSVFAVILAVALAGFFTLFFGGRARTDTFAETLVLGFYLAGIYIALSSVLASALAPFAPIVVGTIASSVLLVGAAAYSAAGFYERTWGAAALGGLSGLLALVAYIVSIAVIAIPVVVVKMLV